MDGAGVACRIKTEVEAGWADHDELARLQIESAKAKVVEAEREEEGLVSAVAKGRLGAHRHKRLKAALGWGEVSSGCWSGLVSSGRCRAGGQAVRSGTSRLWGKRDSGTGGSRNQTLSERWVGRGGCFEEGGRRAWEKQGQLQLKGNGDGRG